jgi:hypothetical protein
VQRRNHYKLIDKKKSLVSLIGKDSTVNRITVHLFGVVSLLRRAKFDVKQASTNGEAPFGSDVTNFIGENFYIDDRLKSVGTVEAFNLIERSKSLCRSSGLRLHIFVFNPKEAADRAKDLTDINIHHDKLPVERTLGIQWCIGSNSFHLKITLKDQTFT